MAEGALFDLAGNVINVLGSFIAEEIKLALGVKTEIENLKSSLHDPSCATRCRKAEFSKRCDQKLAR